MSHFSKFKIQTSSDILIHTEHVSMSLPPPKKYPYSIDFSEIVRDDFFSASYKK